MANTTKYKPEYADQVHDYLKTTGREQTSLPKVKSFALFLGVSRKTLYNWEKQFEEFAEALDYIRLRQYEQLVDDGVYGGKEVNSTIVKLMLQNNHKMKERKDVTSNDETLDNFTDEQVDKIAERIAARSRGDGDTPGQEESD